jgi:hypothetical protein
VSGCSTPSSFRTAASQGRPLEQPQDNSPDPAHSSHLHTHTRPADARACSWAPWAPEHVQALATGLSLHDAPGSYMLAALCAAPPAPPVPSLLVQLLLPAPSAEVEAAALVRLARQATIATAGALLGRLWSLPLLLRCSSLSLGPRALAVGNAESRAAIAMNLGAAGVLP